MTHTLGYTGDPMNFDRPVEPYAPLEPVSTCDPQPKPGVLAFRDWVLANWEGRPGGIARDCDVGASSKHHEGRAWDWFPPDPVAANAFLAELLASDVDGEAEALARRAGLRTIIWWGRIWIAGLGWQQYSKSAHRDHLHFGFSWKGAHGQTSFYEREEVAQLIRVVPFCVGLRSCSGSSVDELPQDVSERIDDAPSEPDPFDPYEDD